MQKEATPGRRAAPAHLLGSRKRLPPPPAEPQPSTPHRHCTAQDSSLSPQGSTACHGDFRGGRATVSAVTPIM